MSKFIVRENKQVSQEYYLMEIEADDIIDTVEPGQFFNIRINKNETLDPLLRRPISIHDIDEEKGSLYLLYRIVGRGTRLLSYYNSGETLDILGPLGSGFRTDISNKDIIILGGGMGIAPLFLLNKVLLQNNNKVTLLLGGNKKDDMQYFYDKFSISHSNLTISYTTIDGSLGFKGNVIDLWKDIAVYDYDYLYTCGPRPMLIRVQELAKEYRINGEVSLEERMGCGIGLCLSCVCQTTESNQRVCKEGPVFKLNTVNFSGKINGCDCNE